MDKLKFINFDFKIKCFQKELKVYEREDLFGKQYKEKMFEIFF